MGTVHFSVVEFTKINCINSFQHLTLKIFPCGAFIKFFVLIFDILRIHLFAQSHVLLDMDSIY